MKRPAGRGYGYVAVSRFRSRAGCHVYGKLRRTDFLPVGEDEEGQVLERGYYSVSSEDDDGAGLEYAFGDGDRSTEVDDGSGLEEWWEGSQEGEAALPEELGDAALPEVLPPGLDVDFM